MPNLRNVAVLPLAVALAAACVPPAEQARLEEEQGLVEPTFAPATEGAGEGATEVPASPSAPTPSGVPSPGAPASPRTDATGVPDDTTAPATEEPAAVAAPVSASISDPRGDVEGPLLGTAPEHADIVNGSLEVVGDRVTLAIGLGATTPETAEDEDHTMNLASFYDVDGDGRIDYEVWANLSSTGWGTSWFDNREGTALFGSDDAVEVEVTPGALLLRFPSAYVGDADRFRWALAAEWGTYEALATGTMTSDHAPDDGRPAAFPG